MPALVLEIVCNFLESDEYVILKNSFTDIATFYNKTCRYVSENPGSIIPNLSPELAEADCRLG